MFDISEYTELAAIVGYTFMAWFGLYLLVQWFGLVGAGAIIVATGVIYFARPLGKRAIASIE